MECFDTTLSGSKYERKRARISLKKSKLLQNIKGYNGFVIDSQDTLFSCLFSDQPDLQQLWIKSISSKLNKLDKRNNKLRNTVQGPSNSITRNEHSPQSSRGDSRQELERIPIDHSNDAFYPLMDKFLEFFPELTKGKLAKIPQTYTKPTEVKEKTTNNYQKIKKVEQKPLQIERKTPVQATNANILEKLDEYFQFK